MRPSLITNKNNFHRCRKCFFFCYRPFSKKCIFLAEILAKWNVCPWFHPFIENSHQVADDDAKSLWLYQMMDLIRRVFFLSFSKREDWPFVFGAKLCMDLTGPWHGDYEKKESNITFASPLLPSDDDDTLANNRSIRTLLASIAL